MKSFRLWVWSGNLGRAPQGARGLKSITVRLTLFSCLSRPARGAWVEILWESGSPLSHGVAPRKGRVG